MNANLPSSRFPESVVEDAALEWLATPGYGVPDGREIAPGEMYAERQDFREAALDRHLGEALRAAQPGAARRGAGRRLPGADMGLRQGLVCT